MKENSGFFVRWKVGTAANFPEHPSLGIHDIEGTHILQLVSSIGDHFEKDCLRAEPRIPFLSNVFFFQCGLFFVPVYDLLFLLLL